MVGLLVMGLQLHVHEILQLHGIGVAVHHEAQVVGDELEGVMVGQDLGVTLEDGALGRGLHVLLQGHEAVFARLVEQLV